MLRRTQLIGLAVAPLLLAACSGDLYTEPRDEVTLSLGNAVRANKAIQTIDPWPPGSARTSLTYSGKPAQTAAERYYSGTILPPVAMGTNAGLGGASAQAAPSAPPPSTAK